MSGSTRITGDLLARETRDRKFLSGIITGDERALSDLFNAYYPELTAFARGYTYSHAVAQDVLQDVFTALWIQRSGLEISSTVAGYLYGAVRNRCLNIRRHEKLIDRYEQSQKPEISNSAIQNPDVEAVLLAEAIESAVEKLPARSREIFRLCREGALTHREVAQVLGITENAVSVSMSRTLKNLHDALKDWL